jgi:26S proteasome regulatory subunit N9
MRMTDPNDILTSLTALLSRISKTDAPEAYILLLSSLAHAKLLFGDIEGTRTDLDECSKVLDELDGVEPTVHASYYGVAADYHKVGRAP